MILEAVVGVIVIGMVLTTTEQEVGELAGFRLIVLVINRGCGTARQNERGNNDENKIDGFHSKS